MQEYLRLENTKTEQNEGNLNAVLATEKYDLTNLFSPDVERQQFYEQIKMVSAPKNLQNDFYYKETKKAVE